MIQALKLDRIKSREYLRQKESILLSGNPSCESFLISEIIHNCSNYESLMWSLFKEDKQECLAQITELLKEISNLDSRLVWSCIEKQKKYKKEYSYRHKKSLWIVD